MSILVSPLLASPVKGTKRGRANLDAPIVIITKNAVNCCVDVSTGDAYADRDGAEDV